MESLIERLNRPTNGAGLVVFRILFGALLMFEALHVFVPWSEEIFAPNRFHFSYPLFAFVSPLPSPWHHLEPVVLAVLAGGIMIGYRFRLCAILAAIVYGHLFFIDQLVFNNHLYLYWLVIGLLAVTPAASFWSLDSWVRSRKSGAGGEPMEGGNRLVPRWSVWLLRFQLFIVYFFGAVAKMNGDWLRGEPVRHWMAQVSEKVWFGDALKLEPVVLGIAYGGLLFDLLIGFTLLYRRTFWLGVLGIVAFHGMNSQLFLIGSFPVFGIVSVIIFLPRDLGERLTRRVDGLLRRLSKSTPPDDASVFPLLPGQISRGGAAVAIAYMAVQILLPLRPLVFPGNPAWTDNTNTFSWRMMLRDKDTEARFVISPEAAQMLERYPQLRLTDSQSLLATSDPDVLHQYANWLGDKLTLLGVSDPSVRAIVVCSLNGRPFELLIDPTVDLTSVHNPWFGTASWIMPLRDDLPIGEYPASHGERRRAAIAALDAATLASRSRLASGGSGGAGNKHSGQGSPATAQK